MENNHNLILDNGLTKWLPAISFPEERKHNTEEDNDMTVCIAAISGGSTIQCVADRMLTAEDVEFEPPTTKIIRVGNSVYALTAGDTLLQTELVAMARQENSIEEKNRMVKDVAYAYAEYYNSIRKMRLDLQVFSRFGLTQKTFMETQKQIPESVVEHLLQQSSDFTIGRVSTIITGIDSSGPHIFVVDGNRVVSFDGAGFAAVGIGARHAESEFMFWRHSPYQRIAESTILIFSAKKRAETAPGVGSETDMVSITVDDNGDPNIIRFTREMITDLEGIYKKRVKRELTAQKAAVKEMRSLMQIPGDDEPEEIPNIST